jgi:hypothetical protein
MNLENTPFAPLMPHLFDLLHALEPHGIPLILAGGSGLLLRREWLEASGTPSLITNIPSARATDDFDVILRLEVLADSKKRKGFRQALDTLGYVVVKGAEKYQFIKPGTGTNGGRDVKVDLLARAPETNDPNLRADQRRVRPHQSGSPIHAHVTSEAIAVEDELLVLKLEGRRGNGEIAAGTVLLPHPYALLMMKLFAFRDEHQGQKGPGREAYARKHAGDLFTITAMITSSENDALPNFRGRYQQSPIAREAAEIVRSFFEDPTSPGVARMREQLGVIEPPDLELFLGVLRETFPLTGSLEDA